MEVDARGLGCPAPILRLATAVKRAASGAQLSVRASDKAFPKDVTEWCSRTGNVLVSLDTSNPDDMVAVVKKK